MIDMIYIC